MGPRVFINFRGKDQAGYAALLDRELSTEFGPDTIFHSSRSIEPGQDFVDTLLAALAESTVLLAIIGPNWMQYLRPDDDSDWVRSEIAVSLRRGITVIPILVEDAALPSESQLPADLARMSRCQYLRLNHRNVTYDLAHIVAVVSQHIRVSAAHGVDDEAPPARVALYRTAASACRVGVISGSILHIHSVDVWVNSENTHMEMSRLNEFTISGIIRYWGSRRDANGNVIDDVIARSLAGAVGPRRPVAPGTSAVTESGALAESHGVRHIIHVAAVQGEPGAGFRQIRDIGSAVFTVLSEANTIAARDAAVGSVLLPLLGVGSGGGSLPATARSMVTTIADYLIARPDTRLKAIYLLGYRKSEFTVISDCLAFEPRLSQIGHPPQR